ncbi:MAG: cytochrome c biogenesis protein CcsA [Prevotellaceae bacterium]|jgi:ABC-type transport system involved in cytochrome c biogenesis permease subunit|nr:cytochrome c biogenesis protein CcsA [Prevotellaceae bacterium]
MSWSEFLWFAIPAVICWLTAGTLVYLNKKDSAADLLMVAGIIIFAAFIIGLWIGQKEPPLRTIGETRLWYSFFLATIGYFTYRHWKYKWMLSFSSLVACVFVFINIFKPEIHSTDLMPALRSYWFVPHVTVYILSYAMLGAATITSAIQLVNINKGKPDPKLYRLMDNAVYVGFGFLMLGLLMGAVWAKDAWGHYWSWDPKETWAFITVAAYLVYIHIRLLKPDAKLALWILFLAFVLLMITWIGINYLPVSQNSVHTYTN